MAIGSNKRLLLELDKYRDDVNKRTVNSCLEDLDLDKLKPVTELLARTRAAYVCELMKITGELQGEEPSVEQIQRLRARRLEFSELEMANSALETVIERRYVNIIEDSNQAISPEETEQTR